MATNGASKIAKSAFPEQLLNLLSDEGNSDAITWTADGAQVKIVSRTILETKVLPKYFSKQNAKVESFQRKLKRWGFKRTGRGIYSHPFFQKGRIDLLGYMAHDERIPPTTDSSSFPAPAAASALSSQLQEEARVGYSGQIQLQEHLRVVNSFIYRQRAALDGHSSGEPLSRTLLEGNINTGKTNNILNKATSLALKSEQDESRNNGTLASTVSTGITQPISTSSSYQQSNISLPQQLYDTNQLLMMPKAPLQNNNSLPTQNDGPSAACLSQHGRGNIIEQQQTDLNKLLSATLANNQILLSQYGIPDARQTLQHGGDNLQQQQQQHQTGLNGQELNKLLLGNMPNTNTNNHITSSTLPLNQQEQDPTPIVVPSQQTTNSFEGVNAAIHNSEQELKRQFSSFLQTNEQLHDMGAPSLALGDNSALLQPGKSFSEASVATTAAARPKISGIDQAAETSQSDQLKEQQQQIFLQQLQLLIPPTNNQIPTSPDNVTNDNNNVVVSQLKRKREDQ